MISARHGKLVHELKLLVRVRVRGWVRVMVEFGISSAFYSNQSPSRARPPEVAEKT